jgi:hypothetical protein
VGLGPLQINIWVYPGLLSDTLTSVKRSTNRCLLLADCATALVA